MITLVAILLALFAGIFVGSQMTAAREAHAHFTSNRGRTTKEFTTWIRHIGGTVISVAVLALLLYVLIANLDTM